jgi:hypothetical protein
MDRPRSAHSVQSQTRVQTVPHVPRGLAHEESSHAKNVLGLDLGVPAALGGV